MLTEKLLRGEAGEPSGSTPVIGDVRCGWREGEVWYEALEILWSGGSSTLTRSIGSVGLWGSRKRVLNLASGC